jgi:glycosyltransferase involved in cell wall biosynthesis
MKEMESDRIDKEKESWMCFLVPSIGKPTLPRALHSIRNQNRDGWHSLIVFDGEGKQIPEEFKNDARFTFINAPYTKSAGLTRNYGMRHIKEEWVAFLDDDDRVREDYCQRLEEEIQAFPEVKTVIWRILHHRDIVPDPGSKDFKCGRVGIAFAIHHSVFENYGLSFCNQYAEDFKLLRDIRSRNLPMLISPYVLYTVRCINFDRLQHKNYEETDSNRARINEGATPQNLSS